MSEPNPGDLPKTPVNPNDRSANQVLASYAKEVRWEAPWPPPDILAGYGDIIPGGSERILALIEREAAHRQNMDTEELKLTQAQLDAQSNAIRRGQWLGSIASISFGIMAFVLVFAKDADWRLVGLFLSIPTFSVIRAIVMSWRQMGASADEDAEKSS